MARYGSGDAWDIGLWEEEDNPGAGSVDWTTFDDKGLNGNFKRFKRALAAVAKADGTGLIDGIVHYGALSTDVADASTIEVAGSPAKLRAKDGGISGVKLASSVADNASLELYSNALRVKASGITGTMLNQSGANACVDETTLEFSGNKMRVKDDGITPAKIPHDNSRTKIHLTFEINNVDQSSYAYFHGFQTNASAAPILGRAGSLTRVSVCDGLAATNVWSSSYGTLTFAATDRITCQYADLGYVIIKKNGATWTNCNQELTVSSTPVFVVLEFEFDD